MTLHPYALFDVDIFVVVSFKHLPGWKFGMRSQGMRVDDDLSTLEGY